MDWKIICDRTLLGAVVLLMVWLIGYFFIDWPTWVDVIAVAALAYAYVYTNFTKGREQKQQVEALQQKVAAPCIHCGKSWFDEGDDTEEPPAVFMRHQRTTCECVDGHRPDCTNAPV